MSQIMQEINQRDQRNECPNLNTRQSGLTKRRPTAKCDNGEKYMKNFNMYVKLTIKYPSILGLIDTHFLLRFKSKNNVNYEALTELICVLKYLTHSEWILIIPSCNDPQII